MDHDSVIWAVGPSGAGSRTLAIQVLLIAMIIVITVWLFIKRGAKQLAVRRLLVIAFAVFAIVAVAVPSLVTSVAHLLGVGRGADLLLYATVVVLLGVIALQEARAKNEEKRTTYLARRLAIDEAPPASQVRRQAVASRSATSIAEPVPPSTPRS